MIFEINTCYTQKELAVISKALRKTLRKKKNKRINIFSIAIIIFALCMIISERTLLSTISNITPVIVLSIVLVFQDKINGFFAYKKAIKGLENIKTIFTDDTYTSIASNMAQTQWKYSSVQCVAEDDNYIVFLIDDKHGQIYDKNEIDDDKLEQFRKFIEEKTNKKIIRI